MSDTPPPRRPLATFLHARPTAPSRLPPPAVPPAASALPTTDTAMTTTQGTVPADDGPMVDTYRSAQTAADARHENHRSGPTDPGTDAPAADLSGPDTPEATHSTRQPALRAYATASSQRAGTSPSQLQADRTSDHPSQAAPELAATSAPTGDHVQTDAGIGPRNATTAQVPPLPAPALGAPAFARRSSIRPRLRASARQWALLVGLSGLLGLQIVIAERAHLATNPRWRPLVSMVCTLVRCRLPAWREPQALTLLNRDVRPMPGVAGVLQIQASFRNDARWPQAWPWLQLSLSDADGRVIGTRVLSPQDYLGQWPAAQETLAPGQAVQVAFGVREPTASTAAFSFDFR